MPLKVVFSSPNFQVVAHNRTLLELEGIPCRIRNESLAGAAGELPPIDCWPQLCVEPHMEIRAQAVIAAGQNPPAGLAAWDFPGCQEHIEGQFTACWRCGHEQ